MIPLRDNIPPRTVPYVNYGIIVLSTLIFLFQAFESPSAPSLIERFGMVPARVIDPDRPISIETLRVESGPFGPRQIVVSRPMAPSWVPAWLTVLTCILLHGGWLHLIGNMWFLFIFGDNVEDRLGHGRYLLFYVGCGIAASLVHLISGPGSEVPTIGASGSIAGIMGGYFVLYPRARVLALIPLGFFMYMTVLPATLFLGVWFAIQFLQGSLTSAGGGGVAWWAHIGGFVVGVAVAYTLKQRDGLRPPVERVRPRMDRGRRIRLRRPRRF